MAETIILGTQPKDIVIQARQKGKQIVFSYTNMEGRHSVVLASIIELREEKGKNYVYVYVKRFASVGEWPKREKILYEDEEIEEDSRYDTIYIMGIPFKRRIYRPVKYNLERMNDIGVKNWWIPFGVYYEQRKSNIKEREGL